MTDLAWLDGGLYPDTDITDTLDSLADRVDFLARLCVAWDFGCLPDQESFQMWLQKRP